jgi:fatty acid desaturase
MATVEGPQAVRSEQEAPSSFSVAEAGRIVRDLMVPKPWIYWTDFVVTTAIGYAAALTYLAQPLFSPLAIVAFFVAGFALFRVGSFIHEIVHIRRGTMLGFRVTWNIVCGIPMLMPSFTYDNHNDHHRKDHYGTKHDGEYLPLGAGPLTQVFWYFMQAVTLPIQVVVRFLFLVPASFFSRRLRRWVLESASSYGINPRYRHEVPANAPLAAWAALDVACFLRTLAMFVFVGVGFAPWTRLPQLYCLAVMVLGLNYIRNLVAHRYKNRGAEMSYVGQLEDSVTIVGSPLLTELFFPLGLRYHALHHLFPSIPYHSLGTAHRRLMAQLPAGSSYHKTVQPGYWAAVRQLVADARSSRHAQPAGA